MREERVARRRPCLHGGAQELSIQVEERREVGGEERRAHRVGTRRGLEPDAHRRPAAPAEERFGARTGRRASRRRVRAPAPQLAAGMRPPPCQSISCSRVAVEQDLDSLTWHGPEAGGRHVVAEDRRDRQRVLAVGRERVLHQQAASRAEGQPFDVVVLRRVLARAVHGERRLLGIAHRQPADLLRRRHVGLDERRGDAQRAGDVVEARRWSRPTAGTSTRRCRDPAGRGRRSRTRCDSAGAGPARGVLGAAGAIQVGLERRDHRVEGGRIRTLHRRPAASCPRAACAPRAPTSWRRARRWRGPAPRPTACAPSPCRPPSRARCGRPCSTCFRNARCSSSLTVGCAGTEARTRRGAGVAGAGAVARGPVAGCEGGAGACRPAWA